MGNDVITNDYDGYYQIHVINHNDNYQSDDNKDDKIILDRTQKYDKLLIIPWNNNNNKNNDNNQQHIEIFHDIMENMNGFGVIKIRMNNKYFIENIEITISTKSLLQFSSFSDCIQSIKVQKNSENKKYFYSILLKYPPQKFELFNYKIKSLQSQQKNYLLINYSIKRLKKKTFDLNSDKTFDINSIQTKLQNKYIDHKNKNKNQILNKKLIYLEEYEINIENLFETMIKDVNIFIPLRFNDKNVNILTLNSNLLKWGTIKQVKISNINYLKWSLKFIKGKNTKHFIKIQIQFIANHKKYIPITTNNKIYSNDNNNDKYIYDSKIKCEWIKDYFLNSSMEIEKYSIYNNNNNNLNVTSWIKMVTNKKLDQNDNNNNNNNDDDDKKEEDNDDNDDNDDILDMSFLMEIKTMNGSIITLDKRKKWIKDINKIGDISWRDNIKKDNLIKYIENKCWIDIEESEKGGKVLINNEISGCFNIFKIGIKMKDELLIIKNYHDSIFMVEYKLKKLTINNESIYGYLYYFYTFSLPFGQSQLFQYKRILNKKQSIPSLISLKCNKYIIDNDDNNNNHNNKNKNEWNENYKLTLLSNYESSLIGSNISLSIPVYINDINRDNISIKSMSSNLSSIFQQNKGKLKYNEMDDCLYWNLTNFKGKDKISRNIQFKLYKDEELGIIDNNDDDDDNNENVLVFGECEINSIEIANHSLSGIIVSGLKILNKRKLNYQVWIRYNTIFST